jgi:hypothetical protein
MSTQFVRKAKKRYDKVFYLYYYSRYNNYEILILELKKKVKSLIDLHGAVITGGSGSSVGMIMGQFEDSLRQRSEVQISIRSSYSEKIFYEKKKFDDLWAHYHSIALPTI